MLEADLVDFAHQMPWIMWLYFVPMVGLGVYLVASGCKEKVMCSIESAAATDG